MPKHHTVIDGWLFTVEYPMYIQGMYKVYWDEVWIGYVYYRIDQFPAHPRIWIATTDYTKLFLTELSEFINALEL
jgi:hypothetical protein